MDLKHRDIEFSVGDKVFLKVSSWKKSSIYQPYEITERVELVAYRLALQVELQKIHDVFHVPMLKRYHLDLSHVTSTEKIKIHLIFLTRKN
ncbi:Retrotransposon gag protein [Gossypium australe]|uniref:Retrotransposon gag protein n=1 Tax=Gossypium australe TaxID=47621 RepID=A0A5B6WQ75_9ROSI|nr:Retrotransposon gag protein [Gossypium australe]